MRAITKSIAGNALVDIDVFMEYEPNRLNVTAIESLFLSTVYYDIDDVCDWSEFLFFLMIHYTEFELLAAMVNLSSLPVSFGNFHHGDFIQD